MRVPALVLATLLATPTLADDISVNTKRLDSFNGRLQMAHPDFIVPEEDAATIPQMEPVYRTTEALPARTLGKDSSLSAVKGYDDVTGVGTPANGYVESYKGH